MSRTKRVLFICTGNSARSQMAEALLRNLGKGNYEVASAGTKPSRVNPFAIKALAEKDIDISHHTSDHVDNYMGQEFDFVITVCDNAKETCPYFPTNKTRLHWSFEDPAAAAGSDEEILAEFRRIRDQIEAQIKTFLKSLSDSK